MRAADLPVELRRSPVPAGVREGFGVRVVLSRRGYSPGVGYKLRRYLRSASSASASMVTTRAPSAPR